ncbi:heavy metal-associated isoprenylated plant protein 9-like [Sesamum indicum]|uniref:Heavy metal-associated isoprenylated plant protein 9-like n=1 Tax=Sesamum indicum TaxID=4182 RepID=A0A6I9TGQ5_SESIN|nr:heavy metal-associated isoprenylated plant protein 9-like [Sesamum indicum]
MGEEAKKLQAEEKKEAASGFVLFVDLHCVGCANKILSSISKITGVERVLMDMGKNEVSIKGVVEPESVCSRIMKKTRRRAQLLSPSPQPQGEPMPEFVASQGSTVELTVNMHCEGCAGQLKRKILKMAGVKTVETELSSGKVTVTGTMDADRQARIVPQPEPEPEPEKPPEEKEEEKPGAAAEEANPEEDEKTDPPPEEEKKVDGTVATAEEGGERKEEVRSVEEQAMHKVLMYYYPPLYVMERIAAPQIFSDENPNACCIV